MVKEKVKENLFLLEEFFVWINADLIVIINSSFGCLSDKKILQGIELLSKEKEKLFYFEV